MDVSSDGVTCGVSGGKLLRFTRTQILSFGYHIHDRLRRTSGSISALGRHHARGIGGGDNTAYAFRVPITGCCAQLTFDRDATRRSQAPMRAQAVASPLPSRSRTRRPSAVTR